MSELIGTPAQTLALRPGPAPGAPAVASIELINVTGDGWATRAQPGATVLVAAPERMSDGEADRSQLRALSGQFASAPSVKLVMHSPCEAAQSVLRALQAGGLSCPAKVRECASSMRTRVHCSLMIFRHYAGL